MIKKNMKRFNLKLKKLKNIQKYNTKYQQTHRDRRERQGKGWCCGFVGKEWCCDFFGS
jgi:hypothetical protein